MLPNLARLRLCHRAEAPVGAYEDGPAQAVKRRRRGKEPAAAGAGPSSSTTPATLAEEDDPSTDKAYQFILKQLETDESRQELIRGLDENWPVDNVHNIAKHQHRAAFDDMLDFDDPPNRHLFSSLGLASPIRHLRLNKDSNLVVGPSAAQMNAFAALLALRLEFANKPVDTTHKDGCGTSNCYWGGVDLHGQEVWQVALRAIMLAIDKGRDQWQGGAALPKTVAIRAPKAMESKVDSYDWRSTHDARDELGLTLRAAQMNITPPVYAAFPVKVVSETLGTLCKRDYGYICEDGWTDLWRTLKTLPLDKTSTGFKEAQRSIAKSTSLLLHRVANVAEYLMADIKTLNMVARRVGDTQEYEVMMIDFSALHTADANLDSDVQHTKPDCIFFVNGMLFLNMIVIYHTDRMSMFYDLAMEVVNTWKSMQRNQGSFCALLAADAARVQYEDIPDFTYSLLRIREDQFQERLRYNFYLGLFNYGDKELLKEADTVALGGGGFVNRYVQLLEEKFEKAKV
tara:strand:+ start:155 stop:1696 length:1542 start_codon:yes stop_codon:yes gene_type:complete